MKKSKENKHQPIQNIENEDLKLLLAVVNDKEKRVRLSEPVFSAYKFAFYHFLFSSILFLIFFLFTFFIDKQGDRIFSFSIFVATSLTTIVCFLKTRVAPSHIDIFEWSWKHGRQELFYQITLVIVICICYFQAIEIFGLSSFFLFVIFCNLLMIIYFGLIIKIIKNPYYIISKPIQFFGHFYSVEFIITPFVAFVLFHNPLYLIGSFFSLIYLSVYLNEIKEKKYINFLQSTALRIIHPDSLLSAIQKHNLTIKDKMKALNIIKKLDKNKEFGVKQALLEEFIKEQQNYKSSKKMILGSFLLGIIMTFVIPVFAGEMLKDYIYKPYIKPFFDTLLGIS